MKRLFDLTVIILLLPVITPLLLFLIIFVKIKLGGPIFFQQTRPGLNGKPFRIIKFRSMTDKRDAEGNLLPDAIRLTPFGKFLRSTSLDELPELWNVLKGEMSLVGPRPLLMEYLPLYSKHQSRRHEVRPGITGWAQINGRNSISWEERFEMDIYYVENRSIMFDLKILFLTISKVFKREGISAKGEATMPKFAGEK
ncbi:MAG: sugar transferase [Methyloligellaceae bacterium]